MTDQPADNARIRRLLDTGDVDDPERLAHLLRPECMNNYVVRRCVGFVEHEDVSPVGALLAAVATLSRVNAEQSDRLVEREKYKTPRKVETDSGTWYYTGPSLKEIELEAEVRRLRAELNSDE